MVVVLLLFLIALAVVVFLFLRLRQGFLARVKQSRSLKVKDRLELELHLLGSAVTLFGSLVLAGGLILTLMQITSETQTEKEKIVTDRISKGFELLGKDSSTQRVGGVQLLADIARDESAYSTAVYSALANHVRDAAGPVCLGEHPGECRNGSGECGSKGIMGDIQAALDVLIKRERSPEEPDLDLSFTNLSRARLNDADLTRSRILRSDLSGSNLSGATLSELGNYYCTNFFGAEMYGIDAQKAELTGASLSGAYLGPAIRKQDDEARPSDLSAAHLNDADLRNARLCDVDLSDAILEKAQLGGAEALNADFHNARLYKASFPNAILSGSDFRGAKRTPDRSGNNTGEIEKVDLTCAYLAELSPFEYCGRRRDQGEDIQVSSAEFDPEFLEQAIVCRTTMPDGTLRCDATCTDKTSPCKSLEKLGLPQPICMPWPD